MAKFFAVFKREYLERVRTKWFIISTILFPILMGAAMVVPALMSARSIRDARVGKIKIFDVGTTGFAEQLRTRLLGPTGNSEDVPITNVAPDQLAAAESLATLSVQSKEIQGYLVVDSATVAAGRARYAGRDASAVGTMEYIERAVRSTVLARRLQAEGLDPSRVEQLTRVNVSLEKERITDRGRGGSAAASIVFGFAVVIILYMTLIIFGQAILTSVVEEKTTRVAEVVAASAKAETLLAGKVLGVAGVALTQQAVWIASALLMYMSRGTILAKFGVASAAQIPLPEVGLANGLFFAAFFVLGFLFYASLFAAAGATVNSTQDAQQAATPIMMMIVFAFIFVQPVLLKPDGMLAQVLSWVPFTSPVIMPLRLAIVPIPIAERLGIVAVLAASTVLAVWASSKIYRVGLLMYGKRPSVRELTRWIRQA